MEWLEIVTKLGLTGALAFAVWTLWSQNREQSKEIQRLNEARISDLRAMLKPDD